MPKVKSRRLLKVLLYAVTLIILYLLQSVAFESIRLFGVKPLIMPIGVVGMALFEGGRKGASYGLAAGILCDVAMAQPMIVFTIFMTVVGIIVGLLSDSVITRRFPSYVLCCILATVLLTAVQALGTALFANASLQAVFSVAWKQAVYSLVFILPLYFPFKYIAKI